VSPCRPVESVQPRAVLAKAVIHRETMMMRPFGTLVLSATLAVSAAAPASGQSAATRFVEAQSGWQPAGGTDRNGIAVAVDLPTGPVAGSLPRHSQLRFNSWTRRSGRWRSVVAGW